MLPHAHINSGFYLQALWTQKPAPCKGRVAADPALLHCQALLAAGRGDSRGWTAASGMLPDKAEGETQTQLPPLQLNRVPET